MERPTPRPDLCIVGGGIAGTSLATVMAREGYGVVVLERDAEYRDRNKGEVMVAWGWAAARRIGLADILQRAGGITNGAWIVTLPDGSEIDLPIGELPVDAPGTISLGHVDARTALASAAMEAGAEVRFGASNVQVEDDGSTTWEEAGRRHRVQPRIVVGADGRASRTRRQLGLRLERGPRTHVIASVLVDGAGELGPEVRSATSGGRLLIAVPLPGDRARLYLVSRDDRYTGSADMQRMIGDCRLPVLPAGLLDGVAPIGPCATYGGEDTWVEEPATDRGFLIGDAAGYNSPIIGQGLSLAMRDVEVTSDLLRSFDRWDASTLRLYADERRERLRRVRFAAQLWAELRLRPDEQALMTGEDPEAAKLLTGLFAGYDDLPAEWFSSRTAGRMLTPVMGPLPVG